MENNNIRTKIGEESVDCIVDIDNDVTFDPEKDSIGTVIYHNDFRKSRYANESCNCAYKFVQITGENGEPRVVRLYAECYPGDVPGMESYDDSCKWALGDVHSAEKFLLKALEYAESTLKTTA